MSYVLLNAEIYIQNVKKYQNSIGAFFIFKKEKCLHNLNSRQMYFSVKRDTVSVIYN